MAMHAERPTVHLDPDLHKALRLKAVKTSGSVSNPVRKISSPCPLTPCLRRAAGH